MITGNRKSNLIGLHHGANQPFLSKIPRCQPFPHYAPSAPSTTVFNLPILATTTHCTLEIQGGPAGLTFGTSMVQVHVRNYDTLACFQPPEESNKRRRLQRGYTKPYLAEMANVHAEGRSPAIHVPTTTTSKPIGLRSVWHR